ncbi:hypothetical protein RZS08_50160, partial [Arthrospira platensis SPKY1]|nr:hypothetical protein [Arthrospira platensis SPKY1]
LDGAAAPPLVAEQKEQSGAQAGEDEQQHEDDDVFEHGWIPVGGGGPREYTSSVGMALNGRRATESGHRGAWRFRPGLASTLAVLFLLPPLLSLGFWQLDRAR